MGQIDLSSKQVFLKKTSFFVFQVNKMANDLNFVLLTGSSK